MRHLAVDDAAAWMRGGPVALSIFLGAHLGAHPGLLPKHPSSGACILELSSRLETQRFLYPWANYYFRILDNERYAFLL